MQNIVLTVEIIESSVLLAHINCWSFSFWWPSNGLCYYRFSWCLSSEVMQLLNKTRFYSTSIRDWNISSSSPSISCFSFPSFANSFSSSSCSSSLSSCCSSTLWLFFFSHLFSPSPVLILVLVSYPFYMILWTIEVYLHQNRERMYVAVWTIIKTE
jgi:hypothetical protein